MFKERKEGGMGAAKWEETPLRFQLSSWRRRTERPEHFLVNLHLLAVALLEAECAEGTLKLIHGEAAIAVKVELLEDLGHVNPAVPRDARLPLLLVKLPSGVELLLDLLPCGGEEILFELSERDDAISVGLQARVGGIDGDEWDETARGSACARTALLRTRMRCGGGLDSHRRLGTSWHRYPSWHPSAS